MRKGLRWVGLVGLLAGLLVPGSAWALITLLKPLGDVIEESTAVVTATVAAVDAERPAMILTVEKTLKGKAAFTRLPILLKGDAIAARNKDTPQLLRRVAPHVPVVVFIHQSDRDYLAFGYTNGTWFGMTGVLADAEVRWSFRHCEPYLRRTFKGTTAEMAEVVADVLAGKRKAPAPNEKEKPGLGPEVEVKKEGAALPPSRLPDRQVVGMCPGERRDVTPPVERNATGGLTSRRSPGESIPDSLLVEPPPLPDMSIVPAVLIGGPLAMLAMLFPTVFGGWKRWLVLLSVVCTTSSLYFLGYYFADQLAGTTWGNPVTLWKATTLVTLLGLACAWWRHLSRVRAGEAPAVPGLFELIVLVVVGLVGVGILGYYHLRGQSLLGQDLVPLFLYTLAMWLGAFYVLGARLRGPRPMPAPATEVVILTVLLLGATTLGLPQQTHLLAGTSQEGTAGAEEPGATAPELVWKFRLPGKGAIDSTPLVAGERVYVGTTSDGAFKPSGTVFCLDRETGKPVWEFNDGKHLKPVYSSPCLAGGKLYVGEGYHEDAECKVYCVKADTGEKVWQFQAGSHTESTPTVVDGKVFTGAGDDGLYCLGADTGEKVWNFPGFHIDAPPTVQGGQVYAGCGVGDTYKTTGLVCLDQGTGEPVWRVNTEVPVWGKPVVSGGRVYYTAGNGRVGEPADNPVGLVGCVQAEDGQEVWTHRPKGSVLGSVVLSPRYLYFGCHDGTVSCLERDTGKLVWSRPVGDEVTAAPALARCSDSGMPVALYVAANGGVLALSPTTGRVLWQVNLTERAGVPVDVHVSPVVEVLRDPQGGERRRIHVAATLKGTGRVGELYCFEDRLKPVPAE